MSSALGQVAAVGFGALRAPSPLCGQTTGTEFALGPHNGLMDFTLDTALVAPPFQNALNRLEAVGFADALWAPLVSRR